MSQQIAGYLVNGCPNYHPGLAYDYVLAGNGLFIQAENAHLRALSPVAACHVRGLDDLDANFTLRHGKVPQRFFDLALSVLLASPGAERYAGIVWNDSAGCYQLYVPEQTGSIGRVEYRTAENTVFEIHSHGTMPPFFSSMDDADEQGFCIYGVAGNLADPALRLGLRLGVYGYFMPVRWSDVFEGALSGVQEQSGEECAQ